MHKRQISVEELLAYEQCPHQYSLLKKTIEQNGGQKETPDYSVNKISSYYFSHIMLGRIPSYRAMLNKWEKTWFKNVDIADIIIGTYPATHNNFIRTNTNIATGLKEFCEFWKQGYTPILLNENINISSAGIYVSIPVPAVVKNPSGNLEIVVVSSSSNPKRLLTEKKKREFHLMQAAFYHHTGKKLQLHIYALGAFDTDNNSKYIPYKEGALNKTKTILEGISKGISTKTNKCSGCMVKQICRKKEE